MKKVLYLLIALSFVAGLTIGSSHVSAQQTSIPNWVRNTALWWGQGQVSDADFIGAIQWLIDNGIIHMPSVGTGQPQLPQTPSILFAPCPEVNLKTPSTCLGQYLPSPSEIGSQWSTQNGVGIPRGVNSPVLAQLVREDYENLNANPLELFDVWIEEYQPPAKGHEVFKVDEQEMQGGATKFIGDAKSNDTSFICICSDGVGGTSYHSEFVVGSVVVKVDGIGNAKDVITDMSSINKSILDKMTQAN